MHMAQQEDDNLQNLHPETVLLTAELLGNLSALQMPFNVQNLIGNWLVLIGQIFLVFNAQQQLWENGPGNCYSCQGKNSAVSQTSTAEEHTTRQDMAAELTLLRQQVADLQRQVTRLEGNIRET